MIVKRYLADKIGNQELRLGRVGEHLAKCFEFDVSSWITSYPDAYVIVFVVPPVAPGSRCAPSGYIATTEFENGIVTWKITRADTATKGRGSLELILYGQDGTVLQSVSTKTRILPSLSHQNDQLGCDCNHHHHSGMPPMHNNPMGNWVDQAARIRAETLEYAERAELALEAAEALIFEGAMPRGGEAGHVLTKTSNADYDARWVEATFDFEIINAPTRYDFPAVGEPDKLYKAESESKLYQWNSEKLQYEPIVSGSDTSIEDGTIIHGGGAEAMTGEETIIHGGKANGDS